MLAGGATVAAGVFRRDHLLLTGPGFTGESWHNQVHDVVSGVAYGAMLVAPLLLAVRVQDGRPQHGQVHVADRAVQDVAEFGGQGAGQAVCARLGAGVAGHLHA